MGESAALKAGLGRAACDLNLLFISQRAGSVKQTRNITAPAVILCHRDQKASSTFQNHISTQGPKAPFNPSSLIACPASPDCPTAKTATCFFLSTNQPCLSLLCSTPGHAKLFIPFHPQEAPAQSARCLGWGGGHLQPGDTIATNPPTAPCPPHPAQGFPLQPSPKSPGHKWG